MLYCVCADYSLVWEHLPLGFFENISSKLFSTVLQVKECTLSCAIMYDRLPYVITCHHDQASAYIYMYIHIYIYTYI